MEPQLKDVIVELTSEASFVRIFPLSVNNFESYVFVGRPSSELQHCKVGIAFDGYKLVLRRVRFFDEIRVENVEFVTLYDLGRRIIHIVVSLIVFIPLESCKEYTKY